VTLEVTGRRSGCTISLPLIMARLNGERYLVSMLGTEAGWVRNVQAADGKAVQLQIDALPDAESRRLAQLIPYNREILGACE
jgi:hypothetical protein